MQQSKGSSNFDAKMRRNTIIGLISCTILLCACIGSCSQNSNSSTSSSKAKPALHPTNPKPTFTPIPLIDGVPYATNGSFSLGGTLDAFTSKYGKPNVLIPGAAHPSAIGFIPGCGLYDCLVLEFEQGFDNKHYIDYIAFGFPNANVDLAKAKSYCEPFMPKDEKFVKKSTATPGPGLDYIYTSSALTKTFPVDDFPSSDDNPPPSGTFSIEYSNVDGSTSLYGGCVVTLGG